MALYGFGTVEGIVKMPYKAIMKLVEATKDEEIQRIMKERNGGHQQT